VVDTRADCEHAWVWRRLRNQGFGHWECVRCYAHSARTELDENGRAAEPPPVLLTRQDADAVLRYIEKVLHGWAVSDEEREGYGVAAAKLRREEKGALNL
jgi:hypothetical protein